jgi:hypothetical protein
VLGEDLDLEVDRVDCGAKARSLESGRGEGM